MHKNQLTRAFQLTQFYGETLEHLRYVIHGEDEILEKKFYGAADIKHLIFGKEGENLRCC
jgi:hypothetical protein